MSVYLQKHFWDSQKKVFTLLAQRQSTLRQGARIYQHAWDLHSPKASIAGKSLPPGDPRRPTCAGSLPQTPKGILTSQWAESRGPTGSEGSLLTPQEMVKLVLSHGPNSEHALRGRSMAEVERNMARRATQLGLMEEEISLRT